MREIKASLEAVIGAVAHGSESDRWFLDAETGRVFLISVDFQEEEEIISLIDKIKNESDRYIPLPYLKEEDFLDEVRMYARLLSDNPALGKLLLQAAESGYSRAQIKKILNREPGQGRKFGEFLLGRVRERVQLWLEHQGIKLTG